MTEPRGVPEYPADVKDDRFYCLECICQVLTVIEIKNHHMLHHQNQTPLNQIDYARGDQLKWMRSQREKWIEEQAEAFAHELHPGFGAEDFSAEWEIRSA